MLENRMWGSQGAGDVGRTPPNTNKTEHGNQSEKNYTDTITYLQVSAKTDPLSIGEGHNDHGEDDWVVTPVSPTPAAIPPTATGAALARASTPPVLASAAQR